MQSRATNRDRHNPARIRRSHDRTKAGRRWLGVVRHSWVRCLLSSSSSGIENYYGEIRVEKMLQKFNMKDAAGADSPVFDVSLLESDQNTVEFPYRELIGSLQWVSTIARPDVTQPVSALASYSSKPPTRARVNAGKRVLKFLKKTIDEGLHYSPSREEDFRAIYVDLMKSQLQQKCNNDVASKKSLLEAMIWGQIFIYFLMRVLRPQFVSDRFPAPYCITNLSPSCGAPINNLFEHTVRRKRST